MTDIKDVMPEQPSRSSGRKYVAWVFILALVEGVAVAYFKFESWPVLAVVNALPVSALLIAKASTTLDLNKWMESAVRIAEARRG